MTPFRGAALTAQMEAFNESMSVEWLFGDIVEYFKFMDFKKNLKIGLSLIGNLYVVCALLRNGLTCLYGNSTSSFFELKTLQRLRNISLEIFLIAFLQTANEKFSYKNQLKLVYHRFNELHFFRRQGE